MHGRAGAVRAPCTYTLLKGPQSNLSFQGQDTRKDARTRTHQTCRRKLAGTFTYPSLTHQFQQNQQSTLELSSSPVFNMRSGLHKRSNTISSISSADPPPLRAGTPGVPREQQAAHIEQVRMLVLGMEQRLQVREEKLLATIARAENEGRKFEEGRMGLGLAGPEVGA